MHVCKFYTLIAGAVRFFRHSTKGYGACYIVYDLEYSRPKTAWNSPDIAASAQNIYGGHVEMKRWLCDRRVVEDIHGPKVYTFTFLFVLSTVMAPITKRRERKEVQEGPAA